MEKFRLGHTGFGRLKLHLLVLVFLLFAIGIGCGPEGAGDTSGGIPGGGVAGGGVAQDAAQDAGGGGDASAAFNEEESDVKLKGDVNIFPMADGWTWIMGELVNKGSVPLGHVAIHFSFQDGAFKTSGSVNGSCMTDTDTGLEIVTCLKPEEVGAFHIMVHKPYDWLGSFVYNISPGSEAVAEPDAKLEVIGPISIIDSGANGVSFSAEVKNTGDQPMTSEEIHFTAKDVNGLVIGGRWRLNTTISTLNVNQTTILYDNIFEAKIDDVYSFYYKTWWRDSPDSSTRKDTNTSQWDSDEIFQDQDYDYDQEYEQDLDSESESDQDYDYDQEYDQDQDYEQDSDQDQDYDQETEQD